MLSKTWLLGTVPLAIVGLVVLIALIRRLVRTMGASELLRVPLQDTTILEFENSGSVQIHLEGPRFPRAFDGLRYTITDPARGDAVPLSAATILMQSSGIDNARVLWGTADIPHAGNYTLQIDNLSAAKDITRCRLVFTRPYTFVMVLSVLGIVFAALAFVGGTVFSCIVGVRGR